MSNCVWVLLPTTYYKTVQTGQISTVTFVYSCHFCLSQHLLSGNESWLSWWSGKAAQVNKLLPKEKSECRVCSMWKCCGAVAMTCRSIATPFPVTPRQAFLSCYHNSCPILIYTLGGTVRVKCFAPEHNTMDHLIQSTICRPTCNVSLMLRCYAWVVVSVFSV